MTKIVSELQRKHNLHVQREMARWKRNYKLLSETIRANKAMLAVASARGDTQSERMLHMSLSCMRSVAMDALAVRKEIKAAARSLSYAWATKEEVAVAKATGEQETDEQFLMSELEDILGHAAIFRDMCDLQAPEVSGIKIIDLGEVDGPEQLVNAIKQAINE